VFVRVDVIERKAGRAIGLELRLDFCCDLPAHRRARKYLEPETRHVIAKSPGRIDEVRQASRRQDGVALDQHEMQADAQSGQPAGARHRILDRGTADHEAGGGQDAVAMRNFDRIVDLGSKPEIIGGDNRLLQDTGSRRSRRKWKNSTPSRTRRFNTAGLLIISPTMAAIFGARK